MPLFSANFRLCSIKCRAIACPRYAGSTDNIRNSNISLTLNFVNKFNFLFSLYKKLKIIL